MSRRNLTKSASVPLSSLVDITFLLLMYFIVTSVPTRVEARMAINLPGQVAPPAPIKATLFELQVLPNHAFQVMGRDAQSLGQVEAAMAKVASLDPEATILIKVAANARQQDLVALLDTCAKYKMTNLNVLTLK
jgi:biopolymer transport protein ExbD